MSLPNWVRLIGVLAVAALIIGIYALSRPETKTVTVVGEDGKEQEVQVGSSGADRFNECEARNGITQCFTRAALKVSTSTPCNIKSPNATSTLVSTVLRVNVGSSTQTTWRLAKGTTPNATTTSLTTYVLASAAQGTMYFASSTPAALGTTVDSLTVFSPNTFLNWGAEGFLISDATKFTGTCQATFEVI